MKFGALVLAFLLGALAGAGMLLTYQMYEHDFIVKSEAATNLHNSLRALKNGTSPEYAQSVLVGTLLGMSTWPKLTPEESTLVCKAHAYFRSLPEKEAAEIPTLMPLFKEAGCVAT